MTFADRLGELRKAAEDARWEGDADRAFTYFLYNHADAILELVRAAMEIHKTHACKCTCDSCIRLSNALAKLNKDVTT